MKTNNDSFYLCPDKSTIVHLKLHLALLGSIPVKAAKSIFAYLFGGWWFGYAFKQSWFNKSNGACFSVVILGENIINTSPGRRFIDKMAVCLHFYPQTINIKYLFIRMSGNKESIWKWPGSIRQLGHVYCLQ